jgi:hypothetical protein
MKTKTIYLVAVYKPSDIFGFPNKASRNKFIKYIKKKNKKVEYAVSECDLSGDMNGTRCEVEGCINPAICPICHACELHFGKISPCECEEE